MKKIGVTACFFYPDKSRLVFGAKTLTYLEKDMSLYLSRPGVMPILIPDLPDDQLRAFVAELDGLVLQGGNDLAPETYGEQPIGPWLGDAHRDAYELKIMDMAMEDEIPIFGICRGFQVMNVYFGGTLYQDIATQLPGAQKHRDAEEYDQLHHQIDIVPDTVLADMYDGVTQGWVNTIHHQAVKEVGRDLQVMATSIPDSIVEAFTWTERVPGKVMGVQWHPEFFYNFSDPQKLLNPNKLYDHFLSFI